MDFKEFKEVILSNARQANACAAEYARAYKAETIEELIEVIKDNIGFAVNHNVITHDIIKNYERPELFNLGKDNVGFFNSGDRNSGYLNSGYLNSGYLNSGDLNSGNRNSGDRNSGDLNSGYLNSGDLNSGYRNSGDRNSGDRNSGDRNSGDRNSGDLNSGDLNSGYRNSGIFCNRKREDKAIIFNKESDLTWNDWFIHPVYSITQGLNITEWIEWDNMTNEEKVDNPKAFVCGGYVKTYEYKETWRNLWDSLSDEERAKFKTLPNYDPDVFEDITGIRYE